MTPPRVARQGFEAFMEGRKEVFAESLSTNLSGGRGPHRARRGKSRAIR